VPPPARAARSCQLLPISGQSPSAVGSRTHALRRYLSEHPDTSLADVAFTLQIGCTAFDHRRAIVCRDLDDAVARLEEGALKRSPVLAPSRPGPPVVFLFPGQGAQRVDMGRELYDTEPLYREIVAACAAVLVPELGLDLRDVLFPDADRADWAKAQIVETRITQPALFVTEYALARLWMSWGVHPSAMIGHSVGEYVAACLSGVFGLDDGLRLIAARGRLIQAQPKGTMLVVMAPEEEVLPLLPDDASIAAVNAPGLCVASGPEGAIAALEESLVGRKTMTRRLQTSHAFHSAMMDPVVEPFTALLGGIDLTAPSLPFVSNVTAGWISDNEATSPTYWAQHLRRAVRFADGVGVLLGTPDHVLLEVGPGSALTTLARQHPAKRPTHTFVSSLPGVDGRSSDAASVLEALGRLWQGGVDVDWERCWTGRDQRRLAIPEVVPERP